MRLLRIAIQEPLPQRALLPLMENLHGADEAARRYRAVVLTTLRQLRGLAETRIRLVAHPDDAGEALRFWLLPRLADRWQADDGVFITEGWEIDFGGEFPQARVEAEADVLCPHLGARWVHAAMIGLERGTHEVIGPAAGGGVCFRAAAVMRHDEIETRFLPELPVIRDEPGWQAALESPLGPSLKRAWEEES
jgi:hypothetical protein